MRPMRPESAMLTERPEIIVCEDAASLSREAAMIFSSITEESIRSSGLFTSALSGGRTPEAFFRTLATDEFRKRINWARTHIFWADERCVPPSDAESNFRLAFELFIKDTPMQEANIHRIKGELEEKAADEYETEIKRFFGLKDGEFPEFDLAVLGLGIDGHTASLFPGTKALGEKGRIAAHVFPEGKRAARVTLTAGAINGSKNIVFLVSGGEKAGILKEVLGKGPAGRDSGAGIAPASLIRPRRGRLIWIVDRAAYGG